VSAAAVLALVGTIAIGYVGGALPFGLWLGRALKGVDVRTLGSGNLGATNVYRALGPGPGVATLLLDALKGALPVALVPGAGFAAAFPGGAEWCRVTAGLAAILGHMFTFFAGFRGGKGVATTAGVLLALSPIAFAAFLVVFLAAVAITRFISVGSILGAIACAITLGMTRQWRGPVPWFGLLVAALVIGRHGENLRRLARGEERRFSFRPGAGPAAGTRP
jgi:acyl phosphate:glycerol-3-phosphate acyltransferase